MSDLKKALESAVEGINFDGEEEVNDTEVVEEELETLPNEESEEAFEERDTQAENEEDNLEEEVEETEEEVQELEPLDAPQFWKEDKKELFGKLPRDIQEEVIRLDKETQGYVTKLSQEASQYRQVAEGVNKAFEPYIDEIRRTGQQPEQVVSTLLAWDSYIRNNPSEAILAIAENNGVDIHQLTEQQQNVDPQMSALRQELNQLKQERAQELQMQQQAKQMHVMQEIESFEQETDSSGAPLRPFLKEPGVINQMINQINVLKANNPNLPNRKLLEDAYNIAIKILDLQPKEVKPQKQATSIKKKKIEKAKKMGSSINGRGGNLGAAKASSTREALEMAFAQQNA